MTDPMDIRVRARNLRKGRITRDEVASHDTNLVDQTSHADWIDYEQRFAEERAREAAEGRGPTSVGPTNGASA